MDRVSRPPRPPKVRQQIHLTVDDARLARKLAEQTDDGNLSGLFRRLVRAEAERRQLNEKAAA